MSTAVFQLKSKFFSSSDNKLLFLNPESKLQSMNRE